MQLTPGRIAFAIAFIVVFIIAITYTYIKDKNVRKTHYKGFYWVFVAIGIVVGLYYLLVKVLK